VSTTQAEFLARLAAVLEAVGVPFMVTGSVSSSHFGELRATNDIDVVIDPANSQLEGFLDRLGDDEYYVSQAAARQALSSRGMFNVIDYATGWKADLIICKQDAYSTEAFSRRTLASVLGVTCNVSSPEDVVLSKLLWSKQSGSDRQLRDAAGVISVQGESLDMEYIQR